MDVFTQRIVVCALGIIGITSVGGLVFLSACGMEPSTALVGASASSVGGLLAIFNLPRVPPGTPPAAH